MCNHPYFTPHPGTAGQEVITSRQGLLLKMKLVQSAGMKRGPAARQPPRFSFLIPRVALNPASPRRGRGRLPLK